MLLNNFWYMCVDDLKGSDLYYNFLMLMIDEYNSLICLNIYIDVNWCKILP